MKWFKRKKTILGVVAFTTLTRWRDRDGKKMKRVKWKKENGLGKKWEKIVHDDDEGD